MRDFSNENRKPENLAYIETAVRIILGHEDDWRKTGNFITMIRKVKELDAAPEWIAGIIERTTEQMERTGRLMRFVASKEGILHGAEMIAAEKIKSWIFEINPQ